MSVNVAWTPEIEVRNLDQCKITYRTSFGFAFQSYRRGFDFMLRQASPCCLDIFDSAETDAAAKPPSSLSHCEQCWEKYTVVDFLAMSTLSSWDSMDTTVRAWFEMHCSFFLTPLESVVAASELFDAYLETQTVLLKLKTDQIRGQWLSLKEVQEKVDASLSKLP